MENINTTNMSEQVKGYISFVMAIAAKVFLMDTVAYRETLEYYTYHEFDSNRGIHTFLIFGTEDGECGINLKVEILDSTGNYRWRIERFYCAAIYGEHQEYAYPWVYALPTVHRKSNRSSRKHGKWRLLNVWE